MRELTEYLSKFENFLLKTQLDKPAENFKMTVLLRALEGFTDESATDSIEENFFNKPIPEK